MQCTGNTLWPQLGEYLSGHGNQDPSLWSKWITDQVSIAQYWQCSELYSVSANSCSWRQLPPTFPCLSGSCPHPPYCSCNWYPYPHRRTDDKGTSSILSLGSVVGNENKSKTFSQKHSCSVDNLSTSYHHYLILLSTRKRPQVPPKKVSIDVKNEEL